MQDHCWRHLPSTSPPTSGAQIVWGKGGLEVTAVFSQFARPPVESGSGTRTFSSSCNKPLELSIVVVMMRKATMVSTSRRRQIAFESRLQKPEQPCRHFQKTAIVRLLWSRRAACACCEADDPASLAPAISRRALARAANEVLIEIRRRRESVRRQGATGLRLTPYFRAPPGAITRAS